jgi:hypothetical protein
MYINIKLKKVMMMIKKLLLTCAFAFFLSGCTYSTGHYEVDSEAMDHTKMAYLGIPTVLGIGWQGTTTPITKDLSLTNKHVAHPLLKTIVAEHDKCDVALINQDNSSENVPVKFALMDYGKDYTLYGYSSITGLPVSSKGYVKGEGMYEGCHVFRVSAGSVKGMSGGGVFNDKNELVGIFFAFYKNGDTLVVPVQSFYKMLPIDMQDANKKVFDPVGWRKSQGLPTVFKAPPFVK